MVRGARAPIPPPETVFENPSIVPEKSAFYLFIVTVNPLVNKVVRYSHKLFLLSPFVTVVIVKNVVSLV